MYVGWLLTVVTILDLARTLIIFLHIVVIHSSYFVSDTSKPRPSVTVMNLCPPPTLTVRLVGVGGCCVPADLGSFH